VQGPTEVIRASMARGLDMRLKERGSTSSTSSPSRPSLPLARGRIQVSPCRWSMLSAIVLASLQLHCNWIPNPLAVVS
jgi:hypothetical protein